MSTDPRARPWRVAVCGPGDATPAEEDAAEQIGRRLAERGCTLVRGGLGGAMAAACRGAKTAGGVTIGILPGDDDAQANPWVDHAVCTGLGQARNAVVAATGHALIALGGGVGTLSEIALGLRLGRPVVLLGGWAALLGSADLHQLIVRVGGSVTVARTPEEAVDLALAKLSPVP